MFLFSNCRAFFVFLFFFQNPISSVIRFDRLFSNRSIIAGFFLLLSKGIHHYCRVKGSVRERRAANYSEYKESCYLPDAFYPPPNSVHNSLGNKSRLVVLLEMVGDVGCPVVLTGREPFLNI